MKTFFVLILFLSITKIWTQNPIGRASNSVGLIIYEKDNKKGELKFGTGTLIAKPIENKGAFIFIVTNRHVLPTIIQNDSISFRIKAADNDSIKFSIIKVKIFEKNGTLSKSVKYDPDGNDLAVINISEEFSKRKELHFLTEQMFTSSFFVSRKMLKKEKVGIGEDIVFIGYPSLLYDRRNISPIIRTGIIATNPTEDFYFNDLYRESYYSKFKTVIPEKLKGFLIDANVFQGSSGSLVFTKPKIVRIGESGKFQYSTKPDNYLMLLGILTYSYFDIVSQNNVRLQLGGVISGDQIVKTINLFIPAN